MRNEQLSSKQLVFPAQSRARKMTVEVSVKACLFDMDGTLLDSTPAVLLTLTEWCQSQGVDPEFFFQHSHGVRTRDNVKRFGANPPGSEMTEEELDVAVDELELAIANNGAKIHAAGGSGIERLPGVGEFLKKLRAGNARWGICTSATTTYANSALATSEICPPAPPFLVTANHVTHGKPNPEPYLKGLEKLRAQLPDGQTLDSSDVLVFEDALSGLASGLAAKCRTIAVCTGGATKDQILKADATYRVASFESIEVISASPDGVTLRLKQLEA